VEGKEAGFKPALPQMRSSSFRSSSALLGIAL
jgi:hypothetical protein